MDIENVFTSSWSEEEVRPLTKDEAEVFIHLTMGETQNRDKPGFQPCKASDLEAVLRREFGTEDLPLATQIVARRLAVMTPDIEYVPMVVVFLSACCDRPGVAVLFAYGLYQATKQAGVPISMDALGRETMPGGVPSEARLHRIWDSQKLAHPHPAHADNYLDTQGAWQ